MSLFKRLMRFARIVFDKPGVESEMDEELRFHIEAESEENVLRGMSPDEAHRAALVSFGGLERFKEQGRSARGGRWLDDLVRDVRRALRGLRNSPGFTAISLTVLALGIGATTAIFSVINAVLIRPLPFEEPDRLVQVFERHQEAGWDRFSVSEPNAIDVRDRARSFEGVGVIGFGIATITGEGTPQRIDLGTVTPGFFDVLGVTPLVGRTFRDTDVDATQPMRRLLLSEDLWATRFGSDPGIVGRTVSLDTEGYLVVGVLPGITAPAWLSRDAYEPLVLDPEEPRNFHQLSVVARLQDGIGIEGAQADLEGLAQQMRDDYGRIDQDIEFVVDPSSTWIGSADLKRSLWIFMGSASLLLLIACANLANLQLARLSDRLRQVTLSMALGAGRGRIIRQLLTESIVLGLIGGVLGIVVAWAGLAGLIALEPGNIPRMGEVEADRTALAFALTVSLVAGVAAGLLPAIRMFSPNIGTALRESGRRTSGGRTGRRVQGWLVGTETALSLILLVGAGLLIRSLIELQSVDSGYDPDGRITFAVTMPGSYSPDEQRQFRADFLARTRSLPQVMAASATTSQPVGGSGMMGLLPKGETPETFGGNVSADFRGISDDYFRSLGLSFVRGRDLDHSILDYPRELVISESLASALWPGEDAVGREVELLNDPDRPGIIVGVVQDMRGRGPETDETLAIYLSLNVLPSAFMSLVVHSEGEPLTIMPDVRRLLAQLDPNVPVTDVLTMDGLVQNSTASRRFTMTLLGLFSGLALVLALAGLYGVIAQSVGQRTKELGVRVALGASAPDVMRLVMSQGMRPAAIGIAAGLVVTLWMSSLLESLLFEVSPTDPGTYIGVGLLLGLAAAAACWVPARATLRLEVASVLREE